MAETPRPTRERLVRAGVQLFQTQGYHGTGVAAILERAKAPKGSMYHHFPGGKEDLAVAGLEWLREVVARFLDGIVAEGGGSAELVRGIARYEVEGIRRGGRARGSLLAVLAQDAAPESAAVRAALVRYVETARSRIVAAREREHPGERADVFADQALAVMQGAVVLARVERRAERAAEIVDGWLHEPVPA